MAKCSEDGTEWKFEGTMRFSDIYDFDPKPWGDRNATAEIKTRYGAYFMTGVPFKIDSVPLSVTQQSGQKNVEWAGISQAPTPGTSHDQD